MITIEKKISKEIMNTDIYICLSSGVFSKEKIQDDIDFVISDLKNFENRFSRFIMGNELDELNSSSSEIVSETLYDLIRICKEYYLKTNGIFNPAVLPVLNRLGYSASFGTTKNLEADNSSRDFDIDFSKVKLLSNFQIKKPIELKIDLGGIGKSYIAMRLAEKLSTEYADFCIDFGGDMYLKGRDTKNDYPYWAIEIENPLEVELEMPTLLLSNSAVATSGVNRRTWEVNEKTKNHLINPKTKDSINNNLVSVTVIAPGCIEADVQAKTLLIFGFDDGMLKAEKNKIPAIFITREKSIFISTEAKKYVWEN